MKASINKPDINDILLIGHILEFEFDGKSIVGLYIGRDQSGHNMVLLGHPAYAPGTLMTYTCMNNARLFEGTVTISND